MGLVDFSLLDRVEPGLGKLPGLAANHGAIDEIVLACRSQECHAQQQARQGGGTTDQDPVPVRDAATPLARKARWPPAAPAENSEASIAKGESNPASNPPKARELSAL